jgi:hypothetical protein
MVEALLAELPPERTSTAAAQSAHRASAEWEQNYETVVTWFEAGGGGRRPVSASENAQATDRGIFDATASGEADILGRTLRLDGRNAERGSR